MAEWAGRSEGALVGEKVGADWLLDFGGAAEGGQGSVEVLVEVEGWCWEGLRVEDLGGEGGWRLDGGRGHLRPVVVLLLVSSVWCNGLYRARGC